MAQGRRRRQQQRLKGKERGAGRLAKRGLVETTRRNLDQYKEEMLGMVRNGVKAMAIWRHLQDKYHMNIGRGTVYNRLEEWGARVPSCTRPAANNVNKYRAKILAWEAGGMDAEEIRMRYSAEYKEVSLRTIKNALKRWHGQESSSWHKIEEWPREGEIPGVPADLLTGTALAALESDIRAAYQADPAEVEWDEALIAALCFDRSIQRLIVKESLQPGHHWALDRRLNPLWVLGIRLPGSFQGAVDTLPKIMAVVDALTPRVLAEVKERMDSFLAEEVAATEREGGPEGVAAARSVISVTTPPQCVVDLMLTCQEEVGKEQHYNHIDELSLPLADMPATQALRQFRKDRSGVLGTWTAAVEGVLEGWWEPWMALEELPALTEEDLQARGASEEEEGEAGGDTGADASDCDSEDGISLGIEDLHIGTGPWKQGEGQYSQEGKFGTLYTLLARRVRFRLPQPQVFKGWHAPTTGALLGAPPSRFGTAPWQPGARGKSTEETLADAQDYLCKIVQQQTPAEREAYRATCRRMRACTSRPPQALEHNLYSLWSVLARDDDWWHCRRLLQMLARNPDLATICNTIERRLMLLLAAFEGGSTEGVLWIPALAGLMQQLSQEARKLADSTEADALIQELAIFAHGTALCSLTLRFHTQRLNSNKVRSIVPWDVQTWYAMLYEARGHCGSTSCIERLPHPREVTSRETSSTFSVGVRDSRMGSRPVRAFISVNRPEAYPCLVTWLRTREPHPALVTAFLWFGAIFHTEKWCKGSRGKWAENY